MVVKEVLCDEIDTLLQKIDKDLKQDEKTFKTMSEVYGEPNDNLGKHLVCSECGFCNTCKDCKCEEEE